MRILTRFGAGCVLVFACSACASAGELERGAFSYSCTAPEDPICWDGNTELRAMPAAFALSAGFDIQFQGVASGPFIVEPASAERGVRLPVGTLQLNAAGAQALLAREEATGLVKDFTFITGLRSRSMRLTVERELGAAPLDGITGASAEPLTFNVRLVGDGGATLAGGVTFTYRVEDEAVARVAPSAEDSSQFEVTGLTMGEATNVYVSSGATEEVFSIVTGATP
jgi:hypothetical protein